MMTFKFNPVRIIFMMTPLLMGKLPLLCQTSIHTLDTVNCSFQNTSYLIFSEHVDFVDLGKPTSFSVFIEGNALLVKTLKSSPDSSTLFVRSGSQIWEGFVYANKGKRKYFYSFTNTSSKGKSADSITLALNVPKNDSVNLFKDKCHRFSTIKTEHLDLGFVSSSLDAAITVIRNDNKYTYLKFLVKNKTSIPYQLDFISFQYYQHLSKGLLRKSRKMPNDVLPFYKTEFKAVDAFKTQSLVYVIPSFGLAENGFLQVLFREMKGDRVLKIKISGETIQKSPVLNQ